MNGLLKGLGMRIMIIMGLSFSLMVLFWIIASMVEECSLNWRYFVLIFFNFSSIYVCFLLDKNLDKILHTEPAIKKPIYRKYRINIKKIRVFFKSIDGDVMERTLESFLNINKETKEYYSFISANEMLRTLTTGTKSMIFEIDGWRKTSTIQSWKIEEAIDDFKVYELIEINEDHLRRYDNSEFITLLEEENEENKDENKNN